MIYIKTSIWQNEIFYSLKPETKIFYLYLISNKNIDKNKFGIFNLDLIDSCNSIGISFDRATEIFSLIDELEQKNLLKYDKKNNCLFIKKFYNINKSSYRGIEKNSKVLKSKMQEFKTDLWDLFFEENEDMAGIQELEFKTTYKKTRKTKTRSGVKNNFYKKLEKEEKEPAQNMQKKDSEPCENFQSMWDNYKPVQTGKGNKKKAYEIYKKLDESKKQDIVNQAIKYTKDCHDKGQWTKAVTSWLNDVKDNGFQEIVPRFSSKNKNSSAVYYEPEEQSKFMKSFHMKNKSKLEGIPDDMELSLDD